MEVAAIVGAISGLFSAGTAVVGAVKQGQANDEMKQKANKQQADQQKLLDEAKKKEMADKDAAIFTAQQAGAAKRSGQKKLPTPAAGGFGSTAAPAGLGTATMGGYKSLLGT